MVDQPKVGIWELQRGLLVWEAGALILESSSAAFPRCRLTRSWIRCRVGMTGTRHSRIACGCLKLWFKHSNMPAPPLSLLDSLQFIFVSFLQMRLFFSSLTWQVDSISKCISNDFDISNILDFCTLIFLCFFLIIHVCSCLNLHIE